MRLEALILSSLVGAAAASAAAAGTATPTVPCGFTITHFATVTRPTSVALGPAGSAYGTDLYVGSDAPTGVAGDAVVRVDANGAATTFASLVLDADPTALEFPPFGSPYGELLYVSANNRDFGMPLDCGGVLQVVDPAGVWADFTTLVGCIPCQLPAAETEGLGEPYGFAFAPGGGFGTDLYVANSSDAPGDVMRVAPNGATAIHVDDLTYSCVGAGLVPLDVEFGPGGAFGADLYVADYAAGIRVADAAGAVSGVVADIEAPVAIEFGSGGGFGSDLYVAAGDAILRMAPDGTVATFATGLGSVSTDALEFSADGASLYVADFGADTIWRIDAAPGCADAASATSYGAGKPGTNGVPTLTSGAPRVGATTTLTLGGGLPGAAPVLFYGFAPAALPFDGGALLVASPGTLALPPYPASGALALPVPLPCDAILCGLDVHLQQMFADAGAAGFHQSAQSAGLRWTLGL